MAFAVLITFVATVSLSRNEFVMEIAECIMANAAWFFVKQLIGVFDLVCVILRFKK